MWINIKREGLDLEFDANFLSEKEANELMKALDEELVYLSGDEARVRVWGRWHDIPRQQVAHGDAGLVYKFSGLSVPAKEWTPSLMKIRNCINEKLNKRFNFVLINRYRDGKDYMGFHKDDEKELDREAGVASLSLGQPRRFVFKPASKQRSKEPPVKMVLSNGSLLLMKRPTNDHWLHSLPRSLAARRPRINLTFRTVITK